jgi:uncharacterized protein (DUF885 family)
MMRLFAMLSVGIVSGLFVLPTLALAQFEPGRTGAQAEAARKFRAYLDNDWKLWMQQYPEVATSVGFPGQNRRWSDDSGEGIGARIKHLHESLDALKSISRDMLPDEERLNHDLYRELLETAAEGLPYGDDPLPFRNVVPGNLWMPLTQMRGVQQGIASALATMPHKTVLEYEDVLARLEAVSRKVEQNLVLLQEGLKRDYTPPKLMLRDVPKQIADLIPADPLASPLLLPFTEFPTGFSEADRARLTKRAKNDLRGFRQTRVPEAARLLHDHVLACLPRIDRGHGLAERSSSLRVLCPLADHHESAGSADSRNRPFRSKTHPRGDGQSHYDDRV